MSIVAPNIAFESASVADEAACAHCSLPVPAGLIEPDAATQFCCEGCRAVYQTITGCGLADYYRLRDAAGEVDATAPTSSERDSFSSFDSAAFESLYVTAVGASKQTELLLEGLACGACVWLIEKLPEVLPGVIEARLTFREARVRITWDPQRASLSKIATLLQRFGYTAHPARGVDRRALEQKRLRTMWIDIGVAFALMGNIMLISAALYAGWAGSMDSFTDRFFRWLATALGTISLAWPGRCFFVNAWRAIRNRSSNLDLPIAIALAAGGVAGIVNVAFGRSDLYFDSLSMLVFLLLLGRYIQHRQQRRAEASVELLFDLLPSTIHVLRDGAFTDLPTAALAEGDVVEVRPGELVPGDGIVTRGDSSIETALLTGESAPSEIRAGDAIFGGSLNRDQAIEIRMTRVGSDTRVGRLMELVEHGLAEKPVAMSFANRVGRWFTPGVCIAAAVTFAFWARTDVKAAIDHSIAMLIVTCPCILGLATPLTMAVSIGQLARRNVLVKSAAALERLAEVRTVVFDKTGTLTRGELCVVEYAGDERWKPVLAALERGRTHPAAKAIVEAFGDSGNEPKVEEIRACGNAGVRGVVDGREIVVGSQALLRERGVEPRETGSNQTAVYVAVDGTLVATIRLADQLRSDAPETLRQLESGGVDVRILSGDHANVVQTVADQLGLPVVSASGGMSPERKLDAIRTLQKHGPVAMIGDGVNDAAALATADVGIAIKGGAEAALAAADVYIASARLAGVGEAVLAARRTMRVVKRNFAITFFYNLVAGTLAIGGLMNPLIAAILMPLSSATTLGFAVWGVRHVHRAGVISKEMP